MSQEMVLFLIAVGVCGAAVAIWCIRTFMDGRRLRLKAKARRFHDEYIAQLMSEWWDAESERSRREDDRRRLEGRL